jgi:hypothetical protein
MHPDLAVASARHATVIWTLGLGVRDRIAEEPVSSQTRYPLVIRQFHSDPVQR